MPLFRFFISVKHANKAIPQFFIRHPFFKPTYPNNGYQITDILQDHTPSLVTVCQQNNLILKLIRPRKYHEIVKLLWGHSRLSKEVRGNDKLAKIGLNVPAIHDIAYALIPAKHYEFIGYYVMDNLIDKGFDEVFNIFQDPTLSQQLREKLFNSICSGLQLMQNHRIVFTDFTLGNVFGNKQGELIWIDTGVSQYKNYQDKKFLEKNNQSLERFTRIHQHLLTDSEIQQALSLCIKASDSH